MTLLASREFTDVARADEMIPSAELQARVQASGAVMKEYVLNFATDSLVPVGEGYEIEMIPAESFFL